MKQDKFGSNFLLIAFGVSFALPSISLAAGVGSFGAPTVWDGTKTGYGTGWHQTFKDINGDGWTDYIRFYRTPDTNTGTRVRVNLNNKLGGFDAALLWDNTTTGYSSAWQQTFVDLNGDGLLDYVRSYTATPTSNNGTRVRVNLNTGAGFSATFADWDSALTTPTGYGANGWRQAFIDMNGDLLPDYVRFYIDPAANANAGNGTRVRVNLNVGGLGFDMANTQIWDNTLTGYGLGWGVPEFVDVNGDGLRDFVRKYITPDTNTGTRVRVNLNTGSGFSPSTQLWDETTTGYGTGWRQTFVDMNADGLPDYIRYYMTPNANTGTRVRVSFNTGAGFGVMQTWDNTTSGYGTGWRQAFLDMNADGRPDYVRYYMDTAANANAGNGSRVRVNLNNGIGFDPMQVWETTASGYGLGWNHTFADMDADGLPDYIRYYLTPDVNTGTRVRVSIGAYSP
jgi:hypothetical protein